MRGVQLWGAFVHPISEKFRRKRATAILAVKPEFNSCYVCDLGGSRHFWEKMKGLLEPERLVILNIADDGAAVSARVSTNLSIEIYDGQRIPYPDKEFDVLICNSVIEHVPLDKRAGLMREIDRVSKCYFVQTPAYEFPIEPHFVMPFVHWLPRSIGKKLVRFGLFSILSKHPDLDAVFDEVHLLRRDEFRSFLPEAHLQVERLVGLPKSYTLYKVPV